MRKEDNGFIITDDKNKLDIKVIHNLLTHSHWAKGRSKNRVAESIKYSHCFGLFHNDKQIGFARVITDYSTLAYLLDVFILEGYREKGLSKWLLRTILSHKDLRIIKRLLLSTSDAHGLYRKFGFKQLANPGYIMEFNQKE